MPLRLIAFILMLLVATAKADQDQSPTDGERLVKQLSDEDFGVREAASRKLVTLGMTAYDALKSGSRSPDREVRYRCLRILRLVEENDFRERLIKFAARKSIDRPLPGWKKFSEMFGDSDATRGLFVEMQKSEPELLRSLEGGPISIANVLDTRTSKLDVANRFYKYRLTTGDIAALLFVAGDETVEVSNNATGSINRFCLAHGFSSASTLGPSRDVMRKLLGRWIRRAEGWNAYRAMELGRRFDLPDALVPAENIIRSNEDQTNAKQHAVLTIAKLGGKKHLSLLKTLLDDPTICSTQRFSRNGKSLQLQGQLRDVALAGMLYLLDQDPLKFGFDRQLAPHPDMVYQINTIGFIDQDQREEAFKRWEEFESKNPLPEDKDERGKKKPEAAESNSP